MFVSSEHYLNVAKLTTFPAVYFALFLFICAFALVDRGLEFLRAFTKERRNNRISDADLKTKVLATQEIGLVKKLQTSYIHTGYAFSQEKGQSKLVTDGLLKDADNAV